MYIETLYNDFVKEHGTLMNAIFIHIRKKMNETASDLDDLTGSAEPLSQYKLSNENVPAMTVGSFVQILLIYQKQLLEVGAVNWAALGVDLEGLKEGVIALNRKFSISFSAMENHSIYVGDEQPFPKVYIKTRMGSDPTWVKSYPLQKVRAGINSEQTWIAAEQEISSLSTAISDELIWKIIRNHRVSINKIPNSMVKSVVTM